MSSFLPFPTFLVFALIGEGRLIPNFQFEAGCLFERGVAFIRSFTVDVLVKIFLKCFHVRC